jgi:hypothetical protein|tara:strand:- start:7414 stop:7653 length:240 start_codon:yes stop_codon:yes gene_type:complete
MREQIRIAAQIGILAILVIGLPTWAVEDRTPIDIASLGPQVGEAVPDFALPDQNGELHSRDSILGPQGAILLFHRSADW